MVLRAIASPLPIALGTAASAYGQEGRLRRMLEETGLGYVLAVPKSRSISLAMPAHAFLAVMAADAAAKGAAETVPASRPSPRQKFGGSWQLATHPPHALISPSSGHAH